MTTKCFSVRVGVNEADFAASITYPNIYAADADEAVACAKQAAEDETNRTGWILDSVEAVSS